MSNRRPSLALLVGVSMVAGISACAGKSEGDTSTSSPAAGPEIAHLPPAERLIEGIPAEFVATVTDADGVAEVDLVFRTSGVEFWDLSPMELNDEGRYAAVLVPHAPGLEYFIRARDRVGAESNLPEAASSGAFLLDVKPATQSLPFIEDFEVEAGSTSLFTMDWGTPSEGFDYYAWSLSSRSAASGASSAFHPRGAASADEMIDWLVSPPLDFATLDTIQVTWMERGAATAAIGAHGLYISTTSEDPAMMGFVAVDEALAAPSEDGFGRSKVYDLSEYSGEPQVWLAWRYQGTYADDWSIDDIRVEELAADLTASAAVDAPPVHPGDIAGVTWTLTNATNAMATNLTAVMTLPEGGGVVTPDSADVDDIPGLGTGTVSFDVALDAALEDNRYLPVALTVTDGEHDWTFTDSILIGEQSVANIDTTFELVTTVNIILGSGPVTSPNFTVPVEVGVVTSPTASWTVDLTPYYMYLAPAAGEKRWWLKVTSSSAGSVDRFDIVVAGETYGGVASTGPFGLDGAYTFYVPPPPLPQLVTATPTTATPGDTGLPLSMTLTNLGAESAGPLSATVVSLDPDLTIVDPGPYLLDPDVWSGGETVVLTGPSLDVSAAHVNSRDMSLAVELTDGVESWTVEHAVAVPWPVLRVLAVDIRDDGRDGVLDAGEEASVELTIANLGGRATTSRADVTLTLGAGSTASATLLDDFDTLAALGPGVQSDLDFELRVDAGNPGDSLDLEVTIEDGARTYTSSVQVLLGEPAWTFFGTALDPIGDSVDGEFDFDYAEYRVIDGELQLRMVSHQDYNADTLFLEIWGASGGAAWDYYRLVLLAGDATLEGYGSSGFVEIGTMEVDFEDARTVVLRLPIDDLDLIADSMELGMASGWCGVPNYYCDHFPDAWGYPYDSFNPGLWVGLSW